MSHRKHDIVISPNAVLTGLIILSSFFLIVLLPNFSYCQQLSLNALGTPVTENFDGMGRSATAALPSGFRIDTAGNWNGTNGGSPTSTTTRAAGTIGPGVLTSSSQGGCYNYCEGDTSISTDRALGFLTTGSGSSSRYGCPRSIVLKITNNTSQLIGSLTISFDYEKYRSGSKEFNWFFYHGSTAQPTTSEPSGNQNFPNDGTTGIISNPAIRVSKNVVIGNLSIAPGDNYYLRWDMVGIGTSSSSCNFSGCSSGQALGIDNLSITALSSCTPPSTQGTIASVSNVTQGEVQVKFTRGSGTGGAIIVASTSSSLSGSPSSGNSYAANTIFGSGSPLGGGYIVFNGPAGGAGSSNNLINITGFANSTTYYFYIFEFDSLSYCYKLTPGYLFITTLAPPLSASYYYRSKANGSWSNKDNWETSPDSITWSPAQLAPDTTSRNITIRASDSIDIGSSVLADAIVLNGLLTQSSGVFRLSNGPGDDMAIYSGGTFKIQTPTGPAYSNGVSLITTGAKINVNSGGRIVIGNGGAVGAGFENLALALTASVNWSNNAIYEWNATTPFETENVNYFPSAGASTIPVFRVNQDMTVGADTFSVWNGLFECNANVTFQGLREKTFRNGIIGTGNLTQASGCGTFLITGTAKLGGSGSLILNATAGDSIKSGSVVTMVSNKNIIGGRTLIQGTLDAGNFQITGNSNTDLLLTTTGIIRTSNADGFYGLSTSTISNSIDSSKVNVRSGRVDHTSASSQTVMPYAYGDLWNSGNGPRTYSPLNEIRIAKSFSPGSGTPTITGSAINFNGPSTQTVAGYTYNALLFSNGSKVTDGSNIFIQDSLRIYTGVTFTLGTNSTESDTVFLLSTASKTARFARWEGGNPVYNANSKFVVERYINTPRKWQLLAVPVWNITAQSINESWMEGNAPGANSRPGYGTYITSNDPLWSSKGFDAFTSGGPSMKSYDTTTAGYIGVASATSLISPSFASNSTASQALSRTAYFLYVRGDRSATSINAVSNNTVLRTSGRLLTGGTTTTAVIPKGKFFAVGNPYASPVSFASLGRGTLSNAFYVWDPKLGGAFGVGSFRTCAWDGSNYVVTPWSPIDTVGSYITGVNNVIQSGQGFFVFNPSLSSLTSLSFSEGSKVSNNTNVFRPSPSVSDRLRVNIHGLNSDGTTDLLDGCMIDFSPAGNNSVDADDIRKLMNISNNFAVITDGIQLTVERRRGVAPSDSILFFQSGMRARRYRMELNATEWTLNSRMTAFLVDRYTSLRTPLRTGDMNFVDFLVDEKPMSYAANRFFIVFGISKSSLRNEADISESKHENSAPLNSSAVVFPNPVGKDRVVTISLPDGESGAYEIDFMDREGRLLFSQNAQFNKGKYQLPVPYSLPSGAYLIQIFSDNRKRVFTGRLIMD